MSQFQDLVQARRSANTFHPDIRISEQELQDMFNLVKFAPSAFNLQHTHYLAVTDPGIKNNVIYEAANKQHKVLTSSAAIVVLGDLEAYRNVGQINEGLLNLGVIDQFEFDAAVADVTRMYEEGGDTFKRDEAIRNASLSAMLFMLIAKDKGWDTCPMIGFDPERLRQGLNIPDRYVPVMMITIGKENTEKQRPRGYRKPIGEFVTYNGI